MDYRQTILKYGGQKPLNHRLARDRFLQTILDLTPWREAVPKVARSLLMLADDPHGETGYK